MLVEVVGGTVTSPTNYFGELAAVARPSRVFREPGQRFPGAPGISVWDGANPELFEIAPGALGGPSRLFAAGGAIELCRGPLTYRFGEFQIWPTTLVADDGVAARPVRAALADELTIATQNLFRLYDDVDDPMREEEVVGSVVFERRIVKHARAIRELLQEPDVFAVQEVESVEVLTALSAEIHRQDSRLAYRAVLIDSGDPRSMHVGYLVWEAVVVHEVAALGVGETFQEGGQTHRVFSRPPLLLRMTWPTKWGDVRLAIVNVHLKSLRDIETDEFVRYQRQAQAAALARCVQRLQHGESAEPLVVLGDFNAFEFSDGYVDVMGEVTGLPDPVGASLPTLETVEPPLCNQVLRLPKRERYLFIFDGSAQALDHVLTTELLDRAVSGLEFARGNADMPASLARDATTPLRASDHDGLVLYMNPSALLSRFVRGDVNADGMLDQVDALALLHYLFASGDGPPCLDAADVNADGLINLADAVRIILFLYQASAAPPPPDPDCGRDAKL